tara:strand:- start:269 stop:484 length:216 start_codon:yes stop_codon:yes gene_type:complete
MNNFVTVRVFIDTGNRKRHWCVSKDGELSLYWVLSTLDYIFVHWYASLRLSPSREVEEVIQCAFFMLYYVT